MKPGYSIRRMFALPAMALAVIALVTGSQAATITKIATGTDLTLGASWGGTPPGSGDVAAWLNSTALGGALTLPSSVSWSGIRITDATANPSISGAGTLTLGSGGIDLSATSRGMTIANAVTLGSSQTWSVGPLATRTMNVSGVISGPGMVLTKDGAGVLNLNGAAVNTFTGGLIVNNGSLTEDFVSLGATGTDLVNSGNALTLAGTLTLKGVSAATNSQTFASTTLSANRGSVITLTKNSATSLTAALGAITRNAGSTLNFSTAPNTTTTIATTTNGNETSGILGPWAVLGTTAAPQYATVNGGKIVSYAGATTTAQPANLSDVTGATTNYAFGATPSPTLTGPISANTLRFTGAADTLTNGGNNITLNGLMNAGSGGLTISGAGNLVIGANQELVIIGNNQNPSFTISSTTHIVDNGAGASSLVYYSGTSNAQLYISSNTNTYSGGTTCNGGDLHCQPPGTQMLGTGTVTINNATLSSNAGTVTHANTFVFNSATVSSGDNSIILTGPVTLIGNNTFSPAAFNGQTLDLRNTVDGTGGFTQTKAIVKLSGTDTYTGNTIITAGTLQLAATGSINNTPLISIGAGGTFDVSLKTSPYTLSANTTLSAAGTATTANLYGKSGGTVSLGSQPVILTYDGSHPALTVSQGTLALNGNAFTVNGTTLLDGAYNIVTETIGNITTAGTYPSATGTAIGTGKAGTISVSGQNVVLTVSSIKLAVSGFPATQTAGVAGSVTVTAQDASSNTDTAYTGTVHFTSTDGAAGLPANYTFLASDNGTHTFSVTLKTVAGGTKSITATDTVTGTITATQSGITVTPAGAASLTVAGFPGSQTAGVAADVVVTAKDAYNNTATGYTGTVHFTSTDPLAVLPPNYAFTGDDNGTHTFTGGVTLNTESPPTVAITATDTVTGTITGTEAGITVTPSTVASKLAVTGFPGSQTAGIAGSVTVRAQAANGTTIADYTGTVHFTSSDLQAVLPDNFTFDPIDNGVHTFTSGVTLKTAGTQSITVTDTGTAITGTQSGIVVGPAAAATLTVAGFPSPQWVGTAGSVTVTAHDAYGNIATGYAGMVHFTSSDGAATLPSDYTFQIDDNGVHSFPGGVTFTANGTQSITATDTVIGTITGSQSGITVNKVPSEFTWKTASSGSWNDVVNWTNDAGVVAAPDIAGKANYILDFTIAGTYTATDNLTPGFLLNQLNLTGATVVGNSLDFTNNNTALPQINQSTTASGTINNNINLAADTSVGVTGGGLALNGVISGTGGLTKTGGGTLTVNVANSYSGPTHISGGQVTMNQVSTALGTGQVTLENNTTLWLEKVNVANNLTLNGGTIIAGNGFGDSWNGAVTLNANTTVNAMYSMSFGNVVSGSGGFIKTGGDKLNLSNANTFTGAMAVQAGSVSVASLNSVSGGTSSSNLGAPTTVSNGTISLGSGATAATLYYHGTGETTDRVIDLTGTTGGVTLEQAGTGGLLKFTSALTASGVGAKTLTLQGSTAGTGEFDGAIVDSSGGATALVKAGTGKWTLSGINPYTGATAVNGGTLLINGTNSSSGAVTVASAATLGGSGTIGGNVTYASGALAKFTKGSTLTITGTLTLNDNVVHLVLPTDLRGGTYTLATYLATGSTGSFNATPVIDSGSLVTGTTASVTTGSGFVKLVVSGGSDYDKWANNYSGYDLSNPAVDTIGNGLTNGQKYAFGLNPTSTTDINPIKVTLDKTAGTFTYTRRATPATTGVVYTVWTSTDLGVWNEDTGAIEGTPTVADEVETVPVTLSGTPLSATNLFMRVQAVLPP